MCRPQDSVYVNPFGLHGSESANLSPASFAYRHVNLESALQFVHQQITGPLVESRSFDCLKSCLCKDPDIEVSAPFGLYLMNCFLLQSILMRSAVRGFIHTLVFAHPEQPNVVIWTHPSFVSTYGLWLLVDRFLCSTRADDWYLAAIDPVVK